MRLQNSSTLTSRSARALVLGSLAALATLAAPPATWAKTVLPKAGGEQQVNLLAAGDQTTPAIAADAHGNYAVAWLGPDEHFVPHLFVRLFDAGGAPRSGDLLVDEEAPLFDKPRSPRLAMAADGRFAVLWSASHVWARLYDADGQALGARIRTDDVSLYSGTDGDLAMRPDGSFVVTWVGVTTSSGVYARSFDASGQPLEAGRKLDDNPPAWLQASPRALFLAGGDSLVLWARQKLLNPLEHDSQLVAVRRSGPHGPWSAEIELLRLPSHSIVATAPVTHPEGGFSVVWEGAWDVFPPSFPSREIYARRFDQGGAAATAIRPLPFSSQLEGLPAAAADAHGNTLVIAPYNFEQKTEGRLFDRDWNQVGAAVRVVTYEGDYQFEPAATAAGEGFVATWSGGNAPPIFFPIPPPPYGQDGYGFGIFAQRFGPPICAEGSKVLCVGTDGRFELSVDWKIPAGAEGVGRAHPLTGDTGAFWFFEPSNLELLTKVLDGRTTNDHFWVFSGALSDVDYTLTVRDSAAEESRSYHNPQGTLASRADTEAFPREGGAPAPVSAGALADLRPTTSGVVEEAAIVAAPATACGPESPSALCLAVSRPFEITVDFVDPRSGLHGEGQAVPLTGNTGAFTFFDAANLELVVKVLDGGSVNGKVWVFYGGLSDVEYTITVKDVTTGAVRTYGNVHGQLVSRADTSAFDSL